MNDTTVRSEEEFDFLHLSACGFYVQTELCKTAELVVTLVESLGIAIPRRDFQEIHFNYKPVPEVYVLGEIFDLFYQPEDYLKRLRDELEPQTGAFLEALGCHVQLDEEQRQVLNSFLKVPTAAPEPGERNGVVLICWDRIRELAPQLGVDLDFHLQHAVAFHEHSHAARTTKLLLTGNDPKVLQAEETVAQWETWMFLRSRNHRSAAKAIDAMKKLMSVQPLCYQIPI